VLPIIRTAYARTLVPRAVFEETRASLPLTAAGRVPNLDEFPWIQVVSIPEDDLALLGAVPAKPRRSSEVYKWFDRTIDRPEIEAIVLAKQRSARAVIEDNNAVRCAADFGVQTVDVAGLLLELEREHHIEDAQARAASVLATGYHSRALWWLSTGLRTW
jgi:predicted nucleic acid-binding protein